MSTTTPPPPETSWTADVEELFRAFFLFREALLAAQSNPKLQSASRAVELVARRIATGRWEALYGAGEMASAAHRGFLTRWCLRGLERLRDDGVLSNEDWLAATRVLAAEWRELGSPGTDYDLAARGRPGAEGTALRGLYLLHQLFLRIDAMADEGLLPELARGAALENIRRRAPRLWEPIFPSTDERRQEVRQSCTAFARETLMSMAAEGTLAAHDADLILQRLDGADESSAPATAPMQAASPVPDAGLLSELRALDRTEALLRANRKLVPRPHFDGLASALATLKERAFAELLGEQAVEAPGPALPERVRARLESLLEGELGGQQTREAIARLADLSAQVRVPEEPKASGAAVAAGVLDERAIVPAPSVSLELVEEEPSGNALRSGDGAGLAEAAEASSGNLAPPEIAFLEVTPAPGPDPSQFDPAWVKDLHAYAESEETRIRALRTALRGRGAAAGRGERIREVASAVPGRRRALPALLEELSIHWLLFLGAFLVLGGGVVLTASRWAHFSESGRYAPLLATTLFFQGLAWVVDRNLRLVRSAAALSLVVLFFVPMNAAAISALGLLRSPGGGAVAAVSAVLLAACTVSAARRALVRGFAGDGPPGAEMRPPGSPADSARSAATPAGALPFCGAFLTVTALGPLWRAMAPAGLIEAILIGFVGPVFLFDRTLRGLSTALKDRPPANLAYAAALAAFSYATLILLIAPSAPATGLMLLGAVHLLSFSSSLVAARDEAPRPGEAQVAAALSGGARIAGVAAVLLLLAGGLFNNIWLVGALIYAAAIRFRRFGVDRDERHLVLAALSLLGAEVLLLYATRPLYDAWSSALRAVLGAAFPVAILPQLLVGLASTSAGILTRERWPQLSAFLHLNALATSLVVAPFAATHGLRGAALDVAVAAAQVLAAAGGRYAYSVVLAIWAAVCAAGAILSWLGVTGETWILSCIGLAYLLAVIGRSGLDAWIADLDPLFAPQVTLAACSMPLVWVASVATVSRVLDGYADPGGGIVAIVTLSVFFGYRAVNEQSHGFAALCVAGPVLLYAHLRLQGIVPSSPVGHLVAIVASYPLLHLAGSLGGRARVFRESLRAAALALPAIASTVGVALWEGATEVLLSAAAGLFYAALPKSGEARDWYYLAGAFLNLANCIFWQERQVGTFYPWTLPLGITILAFTHFDRDRLAPESRSYARLFGCFVLSAESLAVALSQASLGHSMALAVLAAAGVVASLHFRVKVYLTYSSFVLTADVSFFVLRQVAAFSDVGVVALLAGGLVLIGIAAGFEQGRSSFLRTLEQWRSELDDWD